MHQNKRWGSITQRSSSHSTQGTINVLFQQARGSTYPWQTLKGSRAAITALISLAVTLRGKKNDERSYTYFAIARLVVEEEIYTTWATAHAVLLCSSRFITVLRIGQAKLKTNIPTQTLTNMWLYVRNTARDQVLVIMAMKKGLKAWPEDSQHIELPKPADCFILLRALLPALTCIAYASNSPSSGRSWHHRLCGQQKSLHNHALRSASASGIIT